MLIFCHISIKLDPLACDEASQICPIKLFVGKLYLTLRLCHLPEETCITNSFVKILSVGETNSHRVIYFDSCTHSTQYSFSLLTLAKLETFLTF